VDETATRHFWRLDYAPAIVSVEPFDHSRHCSSLPGGFRVMGLIVPSAFHEVIRSCLVPRANSSMMCCAAA